MIDYKPARPANNHIIAMVFQRGYGLARGPKGNVKYLGTYGMESCLAVGVVLRKADENYPRITVAHIDISTLVRQSVRSMLDNLGYQQGESVELYFASADVRQGLVRSARSMMPAGNFRLYTDFSQSSSQGLIFDLTNGHPVHPDSCGNLHSYGVPDEAIEERILGKESSRKKQPLILELDMREQVPTDGLEFYLNTANPIKNPALSPQ